MAADYTKGSPKQALKLLLIEYDRGDLYGLAYAWASFLPIAIIIALTTLVVFRRELHTVFFLLGMLANEAFNSILKDIIREPRPSLGLKVHNDYGMPSSHAQFMGFFCAYVMAQETCARLPPNHIATVRDRLWSVAVVAGTVVSAMTVCRSRVYLQYHTQQQVNVGVTIGVFAGILWYIASRMVAPYFQTIMRWTICDWLSFKDSSHVINVLRQERITAMLATERAFASNSSKRAQ